MAKKLGPRQTGNKGSRKQNVKQAKSIVNDITKKSIQVGLTDEDIMQKMKLMVRGY